MSTEKSKTTETAMTADPLLGNVIDWNKTKQKFRTELNKYDWLIFKTNHKFISLRKRGEILGRKRLLEDLISLINIHGKLSTEILNANGIFCNVA